jgi:hypothetical protein
MSKKTLDVAAITNELQGASLFFTKPIDSPALDSSNTNQINHEPVSNNSEHTSINPIVTTQVEPPQTPKLSNEKATEHSNERPSERNDEQTNDRTEEHKSGRTYDQTIKRTDEQKVERPKRREVVRHSFDIYADQLFALKEIALSREKITGYKVLLGDLAKEALDILIKREKPR